MNGSLRVRLFGLAAVTIAAALGAAWLALTASFEGHVRSRLGTELTNHFVWIAANLTDEAGRVSLAAKPPDPRFGRPLGGLYWQIVPEDGPPIRSRSLWDESLPGPVRHVSGASSYEAAGPEARQLLLRAETLTFAAGDAEKRVQVIVAADYGDVEGPVAEFGRDIAVGLFVIGLCLITAAAIQVGIGLAPLGAISSQIAAIRARRKSRLDPDVPSEVRPLVEEVNLLLSAQEEALRRARGQASDLAHGLKTPLTVLATVARKLEWSGKNEQAGEVRMQIETMRRRLDRQLARARLGTERHTSTRLRTLVEGLVGLMRRTPQGERIRWEVAVPPDVIIAADEVDAAEAIGNILENACKWANSTVTVSAELGADSIVVHVDDDGPGVPDEQFAAMLTRGGKLDEQKEGSGLGMAIVNDIVKAYHGSLELSRSYLGGLRVGIAWPLPLPK